MDITKEQNLEVEYLENRIQMNESYDQGSQENWDAGKAAARARIESNLPATTEQAVPEAPPGAR